MALRTISTSSLTALLRRSLPPRLDVWQLASTMSTVQHLPDDLEDELNRPATPWYAYTLPAERMFYLFPQGAHRHQWLRTAAHAQV